MDPRPPLHQCPCGSSTFLQLDNAIVELSLDGRSTGTRPHFTLLVCSACGRTDFFTSPAVAAAYWTACGGQVSRVELPPATTDR